jgi:tetratricopeptide (TPR) repeat protein
MVVPLLLLAVLEVVLRFLGWGGYPPWIREAGRLPSGATLCFVEPGAARPYFPAAVRSGLTDQSDFLMPKPADTVRIFLVGESAARGYPQPRNLAVSSFLQAMLSDAWPDKTVEVLNLGTTAVSSFPLVYQVREALDFSPDLFIFYTGNNEFFGAYGTASINAAGSWPPRAWGWMRAVRGLALVQALDAWLHRGADENRGLMGGMNGQTVIAADSQLREAAARNLAANLGTMLDEVRAAGVPSIVCTTAANESGLHPLGEDDVGGLGGKQQGEVQRLMGEAAAAAERDDFTRAVTLLREAVRIAPRHARVRFVLGQVLARAGQPGLARVSFLEARDLDTMPWRPVSLTEQAIRNTALVKGAVLCDIAEIFRGESPDGATGWELLDDHVHLSLSGQALAARAMVGAMVNLGGSLQLGPDELALVRDDGVYAAALGANRYDDYRVNRILRGFFGTPLLKKTNASAHDVFAELCREAEEAMPPALREAARTWPMADGRPLSGRAADLLRREGGAREALGLYETAVRQVPRYTPCHLEYVHRALACRGEVDGSLGAEHLRLAAEAISQGQHLLADGRAARSPTAALVGRLQQLRGEWAEAVPFLISARAGTTGEDRLAVDQALFLSYRRTGRKREALALADEGIESNGRFADAYRRLREEARRDR